MDLWHHLQAAYARTKAWFKDCFIGEDYLGWDWTESQLPLLPFYVPPKADDGPKKTPPRPTPVDLPTAPTFINNNKTQPAGLIEQSFRLKNAEPIDRAHLELVGLQCQGTVTTQSIIPSPQLYLPPISWSQGAGASGGSDDSLASVPSSQTLSNGAAVPGQEVFFNRAKEIKYDNDDAYRAAIRRQPLPGRQPAKVAHFRNFWLELERAAGFWDTSKDNVDYPEETAADIAERKARLTRKGKPRSLAGDVTKGSVAEVVAGSNAGSSAPSAHAPLVYTGYRHANGESQPLVMREALARGFLEPILFAFGCRLERPTFRNAPKFFLGTTRLDADHSGRVYRLPQDRKRNRAGEVEGPLMALVCTAMLDFESGNNDLQFAARELLALLSLAQERHREGRSEKVPGVGQYWTEIPDRETLFVTPVGEPLVPDRELEGEAKKKERQKKLARKPPSTTWEQKVKYAKIGKSFDTDWDTIFLVSTVYHHIALVRLEVHKSMMDLLERQDPEAQVSSDCWGLKVSRTAWYDLFKQEDRIEAMRVCWGAMGWIMRDTEAERRQSEAAREDTPMEDVDDQSSS